LLVNYSSKNLDVSRPGARAVGSHLARVSEVEVVRYVVNLEEIRAKGEKKA